MILCWRTAMTSLSEYLSRNRTLASPLIGQTIQYITRLMYLEPEDELRIESGPIILETRNGSRLYIDVDEGMGNILVFDASDKTKPINHTINNFSYKYIIFPEGNSQGTLTSLLEQPISKLEIISRLDENYDFYSMCGFRLTFSKGQSVCIGAYLTDLKIPDVWILMPEEVDINLHYQSLTLASE